MTHFHAASARPEGGRTHPESPAPRSGSPSTRALSLALCLALAACSRQPSLSVDAPEELAPPGAVETLPPEELTAEEAPALSTPAPEPGTPKTELRARVGFLPEGERSIASVRDVTLVVDAIGVAGQRELAVELIAPGELPYERRVVALVGTGNELQTLSFSLPVAGTMIHQSRLSGHWEARLLLDGAPAATASFELQP